MRKEMRRLLEEIRAESEQQGEMEGFPALDVPHYRDDYSDLPEDVASFNVDKQYVDFHVHNPPNDAFKATDTGQKHTFPPPWESTGYVLETAYPIDSQVVRMYVFCAVR